MPDIMQDIAKKLRKTKNINPSNDVDGLNVEVKTKQGGNSDDGSSSELTRSERLALYLAPAISTLAGVAFGGVRGGALGAQTGAGIAEKIGAGVETRQKEAMQEAKSKEALQRREEEKLEERQFQLGLERERQKAGRLKEERQFARQKELQQGKQVAKPQVLSKGQEAVDRNFAKEYSTFVAGGGFADVQKNLDQLKEVAGMLEKPEGERANLTGGMVGLLPKGVKDIVAPEASRVQEAVEEVVQRNLRLVLGAQFTEKEGERLISRAYNPRLSEQENAKRVRRLMTSIENAAMQKMRAAEYFEKHGTLVGFEGKIPNKQDLERSIDGKDEETMLAEQQEPQQAVASPQINVDELSDDEVRALYQRTQGR